jgi:glycerol kinase
LRARAQRGEILFGTVDSFLLWRLTGGRRHATDVSNASRTLLFNIHTLAWDEDLLNLLDVPRAMLPEVVSSSEIYGQTEAALLGAPVPIGGLAGDQQAALFGQACFQPGTAKNTYGTGCFALLNTGAKPVASQKGLLTSVAWRIGKQVNYCLEGAVFIAGAVVQWLRDGLRIIAGSSEIEPLAASVPDSAGIYFVPAFVGLGAPHWDPYARGTIIGITRDTSQAHIARAALEAIAYQTCDVLRLMQQEAGLRLPHLKVDGGAACNALLMQFQADLLGVPVRRPAVLETTALGAAYLAGLAAGYWSNREELAAHWSLEREFSPSMPASTREQLLRRWEQAVSRSRTWAQE